MSDKSRKHPAHVAYLVEQILATCHDPQSTRFYTRVARMLPDEPIFRFLAEIRQDATIVNRGAVFTTKVKGYLRKHSQMEDQGEGGRRETHRP